MASPSSASSSVVVHGRHSNIPLTAHPINAGILSSDLIYCSGVPEQPSGANYPGLSAQATHCADPLGGDNGIGNVQRQQIPGSVRPLRDSDDRDEWLEYLVNGNLDDLIATYTTGNHLEMAGSVPASSSPNCETWQHMVHQSISVPSNSQLLYTSIYPPATTNVHSPKRTKTRMRWTVEMHDRFIDAINQLGGSENAKPKAILDRMKVEGLTREQVKSHLQKYKSAQVKHHPSEGTSVETTTSSEPVPSDVQISIQAFALQVQMEFQKKLHDMVEETHRHLVEIHNKMLEKHVMDLHELQKQQKLSLDRTVHLSSVRGVHGDGSSNAAEDTDDHLPSTI
ncbi:hypothetical protein ACP70R_009956 [Stipagrostis hirtigluma subsp. patula]